ncbi:hypothetical protein AAUPMC_05652, partial [Pasteurella multocida subsp. multocida str. Anand1_cattle]
MSATAFSCTILFIIAKNKLNLLRFPSVWFADLNAKKPWKAFSILSDDEPVGFFVLDQGEDRQKYSDNPQAVLLRSMSIHLIFRDSALQNSLISSEAHVFIIA